jgi:hypothetical protein
VTPWTAILTADKYPPLFFEGFIVADGNGSKRALHNDNAFSSSPTLAKVVKSALFAMLKPLLGVGNWVLVAGCCERVTPDSY